MENIGVGVCCGEVAFSSPGARATPLAPRVPFLSGNQKTSLLPWPPQDRGHPRQPLGPTEAECPSAGRDSARGWATCAPAQHRGPFAALTPRVSLPSPPLRHQMCPGPCLYGGRSCPLLRSTCLPRQAQDTQFQGPTAAQARTVRDLPCQAAQKLLR